MAQPVTSIDTQHKDMIHDAQLDYYAKRLATCSSDRTVRVYDMSTPQPTAIAELTGHEGPVWQVAWAHPKFGVILATCCYDGKVILFREAPQNNWQQLFVHAEAASVNSIAWAPHEHGLCLACASSSGNVSILEYTAAGWAVTSNFTASDLGCNSVSWAPAHAAGGAAAAAADEGKGEDEGGVGGDGAPLVRRLVTGSCDKNVKVWALGADGKWAPEAEQPQGPGALHTDWVRDVAWSPTTLPVSTIASCGEDKRVYVFTQDPQTGRWSAPKQVGGSFDAPVWRVSWSVSGNVLAVSSGDHAVSLWKEVQETGPNGAQWQKISDVAEDGSLVPA
eukprot:g6995.t1